VDSAFSWRFAARRSAPSMVVPLISAATLSAGRHESALLLIKSGDESFARMAGQGYPDSCESRNPEQQMTKNKPQSVSWQAISWQANGIWRLLLIIFPENSIRIELRPGKPERLVSTKVLTFTIDRLESATIEHQMHIFYRNFLPAFQYGAYRVHRKR